MTNNDTIAALKDPIELAVAKVLSARKIRFTHESENKDQGLDFYLPDFKCYIECKAYSTERTGKQIAGRDVLLVQGRNATKLLHALLTQPEQATPAEAVSLEECAMSLQGNERIKLGSDLRQIARAVLTAAKVKWRK